MDKSSENQQPQQPQQPSPGLSPQQLKKLNQMNREQLLAQAILLTKEKKRLATRLKQFQPQKQKLLRDPNVKKLDQLFKQYQVRKFALKICYIGTSYDGMAIQQDTDNTIQNYIFKILYTLSLIPQRMPGASYTRSGRTDKGVSAMGNVVSLLLRTNIKKIEPEKQQNEKNQVQTIREGHNDPLKVQQNTLNYCQMMNALLPQDIRVLAASQVEPEFNSRYWCIRRSYKYFFPKNNLNIELMKKSIKNFEGKHNFLNYCKMNLTNTVNFERTIMKAQIHKAMNNELVEEIDDRNQIYYLYFVGNSFLWHQIRFMANIIFMVGSGQEQPSIINDLFDLNKFPCKPNYAMAPEYPLILENCQYDKVKFTPDSNIILDFYNNFHDMVKKKSIQKTLLLNCMMMARRQLMQTAQLNNHYFIASVKQAQEKFNRKKKKPLAIHKPSSKSLQEAVRGLKGKKLDMFQKKMKKQMQYQQKINATKKQQNQ